MTSSMGAVLHGIASAVTTVEGGDTNGMRLDIFERLSIAVVRANCRAIARRADTTASENALQNCQARRRG